jgi:hypothetical protein
MGRDAEMVEKGDEIGIADSIVDNETGIDGNWVAVLVCYIYRIAMAAELGGPFVERDIMALFEEPGRGQARDPGSYDGDGEGR